MDLYSAGLLSEGYLRLRFGGLFSGRLIYLFIYLFNFIYYNLIQFFIFCGMGGGTYYRNFTAFQVAIERTVPFDCPAEFPVFLCKWQAIQFL